MTDHSYPPTREWTLADARDSVARELDDADDADSDQQTRLENERDALAWACREFGDDATVRLEAYTARTRAAVMDTLRTDLKGDLGPEETELWITAASIDAAPWLDDHDLVSKATATQGLPPALVDWATRQLDDLNDLSEGN